jgi:hypothetical protein
MIEKQDMLELLLKRLQGGIYSLADLARQFRCQPILEWKWCCTWRVLGYLKSTAGMRCYSTARC